MKILATALEADSGTAHTEALQSRTPVR